jgi:hypothetical protein
MTYQRVIPIVFAAAAIFAAPAPAQTGFPFQNETLKYSINWPSGLDLGEATLTAHKSDTGWTFDVTANAAVPGFAVADKYRSLAGTDLCSAQLDRTLSHGNRKNEEKTTFDQKKGVAHRVTLVPEGGGATDFDIPSCARDALAFVYYARVEMGQGRVAPATKVFFGSAYDVRLEYTGAVNITSGDKQVATDRTVVTVKGPKADLKIEIFFARDAARTPLAVKVPLTVGTLSLELVR